MPVPRRFDRRPPERDPTRINERIRVPEVRLIGDDGSQIGVIKTDEALQIARDRDLDLVEVAPEARPPVCRVLAHDRLAARPQFLVLRHAVDPTAAILAALTLPTTFPTRQA